MIASDPITGQGAASWAGEGNWVYRIRGMPSWDANTLLEGRVRTISGFRGNKMHGEGEHSLPARIPPGYIMECGRVELDPKGRPRVGEWIQNPNFKGKRK